MRQQLLPLARTVMLALGRQASLSECYGNITTKQVKLTRLFDVRSVANAFKWRDYGICITASLLSLDIPLYRQLHSVWWYRGQWRHLLPCSLYYFIYLASGVIIWFTGKLVILTEQSLTSYNAGFFTVGWILPITEIPCQSLLLHP